jgi:hypothetical protein
VVEAEDFVKGFKGILIRALCHYSTRLDEADMRMLVHMSENVYPVVFVEGAEQERANSAFPEKFSQLEGLSEKFNMNANTNDEASNPPHSQEYNHKLHNQQEHHKLNVNIEDDIFGMLDNLDRVHVQSKPSVRHEPKGKPIPTNSIYYHFRRAVIVWYALAVNDQALQFTQRINNQLLYKLFKDTTYLESVRQLSGLTKLHSIILTSIRAALKVSIDTYSIEVFIGISIIIRAHWNRSMMKPLGNNSSNCPLSATSEWGMKHNGIHYLI